MPADAVLEYLDPATLIIDSNVRDTDDLDVRDLAASIKANGLQQPIVAWRDGDQVKVKLGKRRTLACLEAGLTRAPVMVHPAEPTEADRITDQLVENIHRQALTDRAEATAVQTLLELGLSAAAIGRRTKLPKARLAAAAAVGGSELAVKAMGRYGFLTLDHAAALAEFGSDPERAKRIVACSKESPGHVRHLVQQWRDRADLDAAKAQAKAAQEALGFTVVDDQPSYYNHLTRLTDPDGTPLDDDAHHRECPGHVVYLFEGWDDGKRAIQPMCYCADPAKYGHKTEGPPRPAAGTDPEKEAAERRLVRENNKAWRSATTVRREWLAGIPGRRTPPDGALKFVLDALLRADARMVDSAWTFSPLGCELLGIPVPDTSENAAVSRHPRRDLALADLHGGSDKRALTIALTFVLAGYETEAELGTWRQPTETEKRYLTQIEAWGYTLADIERLALGRED